MRSRRGSRRPAALRGLGLLLGLLLTGWLAGPPAARAVGGGCVVDIGQRLDGQRITLGQEVEVEIELRPGCDGEDLSRHWVLVLQPWEDAEPVDELRAALDGFLDSPAFGEGYVGLVLGQPDPSAPTPTPPPPPLPTAVPSDLPGVVPLTRDRQGLRQVLAGFGPTRAGLPSHTLIRKARDLYLDHEDQKPTHYGRRHIVMIGHAGALLGRESTLRFEAAAAREEAIDVRWYCIGGGCPEIEGFDIIDMPDAAAVTAELAALRDRPVEVAIDRAEIRADFSARADYVFESAEPEADVMGRLDRNFIGWSLRDLREERSFRYRLRPTLAEDPLLVSSFVEVRGTFNTGMAFDVFSTEPLGLVVDPAPEQPSACQVHAAAEAGPDPVALDATAWVTLTLQAGCPGQRRPIDVVLAVDRSGSMRQGSRLADAKAAARVFVETVDLDLARVAVMALGSQAELLVDLSQDRETLLDGIEALTAAGENDFEQGLTRAREILRGRRSDALPVIILLSDGDTVFPKPVDDPDDPWLQAAYWAHLEGIRMVVVCLSDTGTCYPKFRQMARPETYFRTLPGGDELEAFYADLARYLGLADLARLAVEQAPHPAFEYSGQPPGHDRPAVEPDGKLVWQQADPIFGRSQLRYPLVARAVGRWPIAREIVASWRDRDGGTGQSRLILPEIEVRPPDSTGPCRLDRIDQRSEPATVAVEELLRSSTSLSLICQPSSQPLEIVLVIDHSHSMRGERIDAARQAVEGLLTASGTDHARFGLVAFSDEILAEERLTEDRQILLTRLAQLEPDGETNIGQALNRARLLLDDARPGARRFVLLLTDGRNTFGDDSMLAAAEALKDLAELMAVCVGGNCDPVLSQMVSRPAFFFRVPDGPDLVSLFDRLAQSVVGQRPSELDLRDQGHDMLLIQPGSEAPPTSFGPDPQLWRFGLPPAAGVSVGQDLRALTSGRLPRSLWQRVDYRTMAGDSGSLYLPPVSVEVSRTGQTLPTSPPLLSATPTPTRTPTSTQSPTPTTTPSPTAPRRKLWLPFLVAGLAELHQPGTAMPATSTSTPTPSSTTISSPTSPATRTARPTRTLGPSSTPSITPTPSITNTPTPAFVLANPSFLGESVLACDEI